MGRRHYSSPYGPGVEAFGICFLLLIAGFFTWGIAWIGLLMVLPFCVSSNPISAKRRKQNREWLRGFGEVLAQQAEHDLAQMPGDTPDKPYVQQLTAEEQAVKDRIEGRKVHPSKRERKAARKARREQLIKEREENPPVQKTEPERRLRTYYPSKTNSPPARKRGPRGGQYTETTTKDGRPYRRYF